MKAEWATEEAMIREGKQAEKTDKGQGKNGADKKSELEKSAVTTDTRTVVDFDQNAPEGEVPVYLDIDTRRTAAVVEFYAPWCP